MHSVPDPFTQVPTPFRVEAAASTDVGRERKNNEDRVIVADLSSGIAIAPKTDAEATSTAKGGDWMAAVCDGMGGEEGGEVASTIAVDVVMRSLALSRANVGGACSGDVLVSALRGAMQNASQRVYTEGRRRPELGRMGTTATVAVLGDSEMFIGQVGDSRAYLLRKGALLQLTRDQTLVALIAERTARSIEEISESVGANIILQAVGAKPCVDVALTRVPIASGDVLLLCSDGLHGPVGDDVIRSILIEHEAPSAACAALVEAANARGGPDNVSCVVARFRRP
jgi:serine/threonine protein phosphatase PrpC